MCVGACLLPLEFLHEIEYWFMNNNYMKQYGLHSACNCFKYNIFISVHHHCHFLPHHY